MAFLTKLLSTTAALLLATGTLANPHSYDRQSAKQVETLRSLGPSAHPQLKDYLKDLKSRFGDR